MYLVNAVQRDILNNVDYKNYSIQAVADKVSQFKGRPIYLLPMNTGALTRYAYWLTSYSGEYIFYETDTAPIHQHHSIMHELSHILLGHRTLFVTPDCTATEHILMRDLSWEEREERDAEELAMSMQSIIVQRLSHEALANPQSSTPEWASLFGDLLVR